MPFDFTCLATYAIILSPREMLMRRAPLLRLYLATGHRARRLMRLQLDAHYSLLSPPLLFAFRMMTYIAMIKPAPRHKY